MSTQKTYFTTVVFADIAGSSKLYKRVGDYEANRCISDVLNRLINTVNEHNGVVIKTLGDEVMCHFPNANDAYSASIAFQQIGGETLPIRVGMACGNIIEKEGDIFGQAVNDAAAVAKIARGRQIITTEGFMSVLAPENLSRLSIFDEVKLKGGQANTRLYRIEWESRGNAHSDYSDPTIIVSNISATQSQLIVEFMDFDGENKTLTLSPKNVPIHMGRDETSCRLAIPTSFASRDHCHIDYQYGKFILIDHSTNGTYVKNQEGQQIYLRREELPLLGAGEISLGEEVSDDNQFIIKFYC